MNVLVCLITFVFVIGINFEWVHVARVFLAMVFLKGFVRGFLCVCARIYLKRTSTLSNAMFALRFEFHVKTTTDPTQIFLMDES